MSIHDTERPPGIKSEASKEQTAEIINLADIRDKHARDLANKVIFCASGEDDDTKIPDEREQNVTLKGYEAVLHDAFNCAAEKYIEYTKSGILFREVWNLKRDNKRYLAKLTYVFPNGVQCTEEYDIWGKKLKVITQNENITVIEDCHTGNRIEVVETALPLGFKKEEAYTYSSAEASKPNQIVTIIYQVMHSNEHRKVFEGVDRYGVGKNDYEQYWVFNAAGGWVAEITYDFSTGVKTVILYDCGSAMKSRVEKF